MRILLLLVLFGTIGVGLYDFLVAPSRETALQILVPTEEKFDRSQAVITPVYQFVSSQTPESVVALAEQAGAEIQAGLQDGAPISSLAARVELPGLKAAAGSPSSLPSEPQGPPGLAWYQGRTQDD